MITDITQADFDFYRSYSDKMKSCHDNEFMKEIDPQLIRAFYRGRKVKDSRFTRTGFGMTDDEHILVLSMIFSAANTILPNLYYQNPYPSVMANRGQSSMPGVSPEDSAALMSAIIKMYMKKNDAKGENQDAVLNAYFFGLGWKKTGYKIPNQPTEEIAEEPETRDSFNFMQMMKPRAEKPDNLQSKERVEFDEEEGIFSSSESPLNVMLDHKASRRNAKAILHRVPRTLYELMNFGSYEQGVLNDITQKFKHVKGSRLDTRDVDLWLNELHVKQRNGTWILTWIDEFDKPLQYERSTVQGKNCQIKSLSFTNEPNDRYPISHMKIACQVQDKIDKMASVFYESVARARNLLLINQNALTKGTITAIENNKIGGIGLTNKDITPGTAVHLQSPAVQNDLPTLMAMAQQNLTEVMGADSQMVSGKSKNKTLGQDELARVGTKIRESGMQDRVRDFMIAQVESEAALIQQFCDAEMKLDLVGEDFADPIKAEEFKKQTFEFMTNNNPLPLKNYVDNVEYEFDFNMEDAVKPDSDKIMADIERAIAFTASPVITNALNEDGVMVSYSSLAKEYLNQLKSLGNPKKYVRPMTSMQLAAKQVKQMLMQGGGNKGSDPRPPSPEQKGGASDKAQDVFEPKSSEAAML